MQEHTPSPPCSSSYDALDCRDGDFKHLCLPEDAAARVTWLDASKNQLSSLQEVSTQLKGLTNLQHLILARNRLADVAGLQQLADLRVLDLSRNKVKDLQPLQALTRLETLDLHSNCISSLDPVCALTNLLSLNAAGNRLQELPCQLTALSSLTELNLRHNCLTSLTPVAAAAAAAGRTAGPTAGAGSCSSSRACCLPASLRRLSLACNQLQDVSTLTVLRQLPSLLDLCVDSNPFTAASCNKHLAACTAGTPAAGGAAAAACGSSGGSSSSCWYREAVLLAACTPALLRLDGLAVLPAERALLLTSAASLQAAAAGRSAQALAAVLQTQQVVRPQSAPALPPAAVADSDAHPDMSELPVSMTDASAEPCDELVGAAAAAVVTDSEPAAATAAAAAPAGTAVVVLQQQGQLESCCSSQGGVQVQGDMQQQQQHRRLSTTLQHQGSLRQAAVTCGVDVPANSTKASSQQQAGSPPSACSSPSALVRPSTAAAAADQEAGGWSPGVHEGVFCITDAEVEEFLQVQKARLLARTKSAPPPPPAPAAPPGMELAGSRCVLTGPAALRLLIKGEGLAGVTELTLAQVAWAEVLDALPSLLALRRLRALSLVGVAGLSTLPQLHPLLQLRRLGHLSLQDCGVCSLVLLRPYVAFRFGSLASFNGIPVSSEEVDAAGVLFGGLEATLDAALDQAPQQVALAAAGLQLLSSRPQPAQAVATGPNSNTVALLQKLSLSGAAQVAAANRPDSAVAAAADSSGSRSARVTQVLAAMQGPLLPPAAVMQQGKDFAQQLLAEAAVVQQQLTEFREVAWPGLLEAAMNEAWSGHATGVKPVGKAGV